MSTETGLSVSKIKYGKNSSDGFENNENELKNNVETELQPSSFSPLNKCINPSEMLELCLESNKNGTETEKITNLGLSTNNNKVIFEEQKTPKMTSANSSRRQSENKSHGSRRATQHQHHAARATQLQPTASGPSSGGSSAAVSSSIEDTVQKAKGRFSRAKAVKATNSHTAMMKTTKRPRMEAVCQTALVKIKSAVKQLNIPGRGIFDVSKDREINELLTTVSDNISNEVSVEEKNAQRANVVEFARRALGNVAYFTSGIIISKDVLELPEAQSVISYLLEQRNIFVGLSLTCETETNDSLSRYRTFKSKPWSTLSTVIRNPILKRLVSYILTSKREVETLMSDFRENGRTTEYPFPTPHNSTGDFRWMEPGNISPPASDDAHSEKGIANQAAKKKKRESSQDSVKVSGKKIEILRSVKRLNKYSTFVQRPHPKEKNVIEEGLDYDQEFIKKAASKGIRFFHLCMRIDASTLHPGNQARLNTQANLAARNCLNCQIEGLVPVLELVVLNAQCNTNVCTTTGDVTTCDQASQPSFLRQAIASLASAFTANKVVIEGVLIQINCVNPSNSPNTKPFSPLSHKFLPPVLRSPKPLNFARNYKETNTVFGPERNSAVSLAREILASLPVGVGGLMLRLPDAPDVNAHLGVLNALNSMPLPRWPFHVGFVCERLAESGAISRLTFSENRIPKNILPHTYSKYKKTCHQNSLGDIEFQINIPNQSNNQHSHDHHHQEHSFHHHHHHHHSQQQQQHDNKSVSLANSKSTSITNSKSTSSEGSLLCPALKTAIRLTSAQKDHHQRRRTLQPASNVPDSAFRVLEPRGRAAFFASMGQWAGQNGIQTLFQPSIHYEGLTHGFHPWLAPRPALRSAAKPPSHTNHPWSMGPFGKVKTTPRQTPRASIKTPGQTPRASIMGRLRSA